MSSTEDDANDENQNLGQESRKRSVRRACDACRRKKSKLYLLITSARIYSYTAPVRCMHSQSSSLSRHASMTPDLVGDGVQMPQNRCLNCITSKLECTYVEAAKVCCLFASSLAHAHLLLRDVDLRKGEQCSDRETCQMKRVHTRVHRYVESLEIRLERTEKLLQKVRS